MKRPPTGATPTDAVNRYFKFASRSEVIIVSFLAALVFSCWVFPALPIPGKVLDAMWSYADDFRTLMDSYGETGRRVYAWSSLTLDTAYPLLYMTFLAGVIHRFARSETGKRLAYLAVLAAVLDLAENIQIHSMLVDYPEVSMTRAQVAELFTRAKWLAIGAASLAAVAAVVRWWAGQRDRP